MLADLAYQGHVVLDQKDADATLATAPVRISPKRLVSPASSPEDGSSSSRRSNGPARTRAARPSGADRSEQPGLEIRQGPIPVSSMASSTALRTVARCRAAAHQLANRVRPGQRGLPAEGDVLTHGERGEQLDPLKRTSETEPGATGGPSDVTLRPCTQCRLRSAAPAPAQH